MRVDLPAPFSPTRQWTLLRFMSKLTLLTALTLGKSFTRSRISTTLPICSMPALRRYVEEGPRGGALPTHRRPRSRLEAAYFSFVPNSVLSHFTVSARGME